MTSFVGNKVSMTVEKVTERSKELLHEDPYRLKNIYGRINKAVDARIAQAENLAGDKSARANKQRAALVAEIDELNRYSEAMYKVLKSL